jgi:ribose 5-phosphate isomerase B
LIKAGDAPRGILICGSGVGVCVAANKIPGIRAGMCHDTYSAHQGVEHDDMNVIVLGARIIGSALAFELWMRSSAPSSLPRRAFSRRFKKVLAIEAKYQCGDGSAKARRSGAAAFERSRTFRRSSSAPLKTTRLRIPFAPNSEFRQ